MQMQGGWLFTIGEPVRVDSYAEGRKATPAEVEESITGGLPFLLDLAMPGISGWEVATACRERFPAAPIGLITGFGDQLDPERIERHGIGFVVAKPFTSGELLREIAAALRAGGRA